VGSNWERIESSFSSGVKSSSTASSSSNWERIESVARADCHVQLRAQQQLGKN
jgi:hypothetical protein